MKFMAEWFNLTMKFLDVEISVKNGIIETDHSVKPRLTDSYHYLLFSSCHFSL